MRHPARVLGDPAGCSSVAYQSGFGNWLASEALPGALPAQNSPQRCPYGLYAEQLSCTPFSTPRADNRHAWLYRIRPAATPGAFEPCVHAGVGTTPAAALPPEPLRWAPQPIPSAPTDFVEGLESVGATGPAGEGNGGAIYRYAANRSMQGRALYDADGELLIVPQLGRLTLTTEFGRLALEPLEIALIPRGVRFCVELSEGQARGYVCENFGTPFRLPELGPIGSNGLAAERDFHAPTAWYEDSDETYTLVAKFLGKLWSAPMDHSPFDVVAWRGNCVPFKYDLRRFNTLGSISYDHPDPSIYAVLQSPSDTPGAASIDFVIFPPRWIVMEQTFRPPWFHRNVSSEYMGLIQGRYEAKAGGFVPGAASLHNCMTAHGPDATSFAAASSADTSRPERLEDTMAFMFETRRVIHPTQAALDSPLRDRGYWQCWQGLARHFDPQRR